MRVWNYIVQCIGCWSCIQPTQIASLASNVGPQSFQYFWTHLGMVLKKLRKTSWVEEMVQVLRHVSGLLRLDPLYLILSPNSQQEVISEQHSQKWSLSTTSCGPRVKKGENFFICDLDRWEFGIFSEERFNALFQFIVLLFKFSLK